MAVPKTSPIQFRIHMLDNEEIPTIGDPSTPLNQITQENGITTQPNTECVFYHNREVINPFYSLAALKINNDDVVYCIKQKREKKTSKQSSIGSPLMFGSDYFRQTTSASSTTQFFEHDEDFLEILHQPQRAKTRPTIVPPPSITIPKAPLPMEFKNDSPQENTKFWKSLERRFSINE